MIPRVTHQSVQRSTLAGLQSNLAAMAAVQARLSSGKAVGVASDDPLVAADVLRLKADLRATAQHQRNADDADAWLTTVDSALQGSLTVLRRVRDLTVQSGSGALGQTSRDALATEIEQARDALLELANTRLLGRSVFAGTSDAAAAFDGTTYDHAGGGGTVDRRLGSTTTVRVDGDGAAAFGTGAGSVFALLDTIVADLRSGADASVHLDALDGRTNAVLTELATVGARQSQVHAAQERLLTQETTTTARVSGLEDIDLARTIMELQLQEVAYQAALGAAAKTLQPTLLDFLR